MSTALPVLQSAAAKAAPAVKPTAIQMLEAELANFIRQRETAIANVNALDGAIQAANHFIAKLKAEAAKAEAEAKAVAVQVVTKVESAAKTVIVDAEKAAAVVESEVGSVAKDIESKT